MSLRKNQYYIGFNNPPHQSFIELGKIYIMGNTARKFSDNTLVCAFIEDSSVRKIDSKFLFSLIENYGIEKTEKLFKDISSFYQSRMRNYLEKNPLGLSEYMKDWGNYCFLTLEINYKDIKLTDFKKAIQTMANTSFDYKNTLKLLDSSLNDITKNFEQSEILKDDSNNPDIKTVNKISLTISWASEIKDLDKKLSSEYGISIVDNKNMRASVFGNKEKITNFLTSSDYGMSHEDVINEFPELDSNVSNDENSTSVNRKIRRVR